MKGILFLSHRLPYPPNKGDKIRSFHILKRLAEHHPVYLASFIDDPNDWNYLKKVQKLVIDSCILERKRISRSIPTLIKGLLTGKPLSKLLYESQQMHMWCEGLLNAGLISKIYIYSSVMGQYAEKVKDIPLITDFVDVDSQKWASYSQNKHIPMKWIYRLEATRLLAFEKKVAERSMVSIFVSKKEANLFKALAPEIKSNIQGIPNGVETAYFNPFLKYTNPYTDKDKKRVIFTGLMDYWPNIDAVQWFIKEVFKPVAKEMKEIEFFIVGANPTPQVFQFRRKNIIITGRVPDIRPYLKHADVVVAPLRIARGLQNKVLEAMSMNKPIIATSQALEGIELPVIDNIWQEKTIEGWQDRLKTLLLQPPKVQGLNEWIKQNYSWDASLNLIEKLVDQEPEKITA